MRTRHDGANVYHELHDGEEWGDFGMDQPGRVFGHRADWLYCPRCNQRLRVRTKVELRTGEPTSKRMGL